MDCPPGKENVALIERWPLVETVIIIIIIIVIIK